MAELRKTIIHGYSDRLSVAPGEPIEFKVSSEEPGTYRADVVRLIHGDTNPAGPGFKEAVVEAAVNGEYPARFQPTDCGSCVIVEDGSGVLDLAGPFTLHAFVLPTTPAKPDQGILGRLARETGSGYALIDPGRVPSARARRAGGSRVRLDERPVLSLVLVLRRRDVRSRDRERRRLLQTGRQLGQQPARTDRRHPRRGRRRGCRHPAGRQPGHAVHDRRARAECGRITGCDSHLNGKVDRPKVWDRALTVAELDSMTAGEDPPADGLVAAWDFADGIGPDGIPTDRVTDRGPHGLHGACVNMPARGMTGWNWRGTEEAFTHAPDEYGAIHFHDDDLDDCRWETDVAWTVPDDLRSGVYALRLAQGEAEDWVPFFVLPPRGTATAKALFLVPTASYLAYANEHIVHDVPVAQAILGHTSVIAEQDFWIYGHSEFGLSTYDSHSDGSGVHISSSRRPIVNMRPKFRMSTGGPWQFPADLHLVDWLDAMGFEYDVATDRELHDEGADLLKRYNVGLHRLPSRVLLDRDARRLGGVSRDGRPRDVPRLERLLLDHRLASGQAARDRDPQVRVRVPRLAGKTRRVLPAAERRALRPLAGPGPGAAEALRNRFHGRGVRRIVLLRPAAGRP